MTGLRVAAGVTISALALAAATLISGGAMAQAPTNAPAAAASATACPDLSMGPGMMGSGPGSPMGPRMMNGGPGSSMGHGMMDHESGAGPGMMGATLVPAGSPSPSQGSSASPAAVRVDVTLTDAFRIEPCVMNVRAGVPVTFVVANSGAIPHEFFLGDEAAQAAHAHEMLSMAGAPMHDEADGISVAPGETKELTYTFMTAGQYVAGCHVPGHYPAGMKAAINVRP